MYLGRRSGTLLHVFLQGWLLGLEESPEDLGILSEFQAWTAFKYQMTSSHSWAELIEFYSEGPVKAFEEFYSLFDEFCAEGVDLDS